MTGIQYTHCQSTTSTVYESTRTGLVHWPLRWIITTALDEKPRSQTVLLNLCRTTAAWNNATCLSLCRGQLDESNSYAKSVILHQYLFGYELPDLVMVLTLEGDLHVMGTKKKIEFLKPAAKESNSVHLYMRSKGDNNADNFQKLIEVIKNSGENSKPIVGSILKESNDSGLVGAWEQQFLKGMELVDCSPGLSFVLAVKDETELDFMKKSSVLSNKLMKHGCITVEEIIDESAVITHEALAQKLDDMIEDPSQIGLKIPKDDVASCFFPIVQSGGVYDLKVSAVSDTRNLSFDIILVSLGARYKNYCSTISRTFLVDPPKVVSEHYELLTGMHEACQRAMRPGKPLRNVYTAAVDFLNKEGREDLVRHLPKTLGFGMGLDFRDGMLTLSSKNPTTFKAGMTFSLISAFQNLPLSQKDRENTPKESSVSHDLGYD